MRRLTLSLGKGERELGGWCGEGGEEKRKELLALTGIPTWALEIFILRLSQLGSLPNLQDLPGQAACLLDYLVAPSNPSPHPYPAGSRLGLLGCGPFPEGFTANHLLGLWASAGLQGSVNLRGFLCRPLLKNNYLIRPVSPRNPKSTKLP